MRSTRVRQFWLSLFALMLLYSPAAQAEETTVSELLKSCKFGTPVDLLALPELTRQLDASQWKLEDGVLSSLKKGKYWLYFPHKLPEQYVIDARLKRISGREGYGIGIRMGDGVTMLVLDAWSGRVTGLNLIDGRVVRLAANPTRVEKKFFADGQEHAIKIVVLSGRILVSIDGETIIDWTGTPRQLSREALPPKGKENWPQLLSVLSEWRLSEYKVTPIESVPASETGTAGEPLIASRSRETNPIDQTLSQCQLGKQVDLLALPELSEHLDASQWKLEDGVLSSSETGKYWLYFPHKLPKQYVIDARLKRVSGREGYGIGIRMGDGVTMLVLDAWGGRVTGLNLIDRRVVRSTANPTRLERNFFGDGREHAIKIVVLSGRILVSIDGETIIDWTGRPRQLSREAVPPKGKEDWPQLLSVLSEWRLSEYKLTPIESAPASESGAAPEPQVASKPKTNPFDQTLRQSRLGEPVDLLALPDLFKLNPRGGWSMTGGAISSNPGGRSELYVPYEFPGRYVIRARIKREAGKGELNLGLVMGNGAANLQLNTNHAGLDHVNFVQAVYGQNPTRYRKKLFAVGEEREVQVLVLAHEIAVAIDGEEIIRWSGHSKQLTRDRPPPFDRVRMPYLHTWKSKWTISEFQVTPLESAPDDGSYRPYIPLMTESALFDKVRPPVTMYHSLDTLRSAPERTLFLDMHDSAYPVVEYLRGGLIREISRQALSLSARDELDMSTRDRAQGEAFPLYDRRNKQMRGKPLSAALSVFTEVNSDGRARINVLRAGDRFTHMPLFEKEFEFSPETPYCDLVGVLGELSRNEFCGVLEREYPVTRKKPAWKTSASVPAEVEAFLNKWNVFSQFIGVRELHRVIRESGESPERLAALSRGYARLGLVTSLYFGTYSKVYSARSLLYAERLVAKSERSAESLWNRAYVRALVGLPAAAHRDLVRAAEVESATRPPAWLRDIELYYEGDVHGLKQRLSDPSAESFSAFLYWKLQTCRASSHSRYDGYYQLIEHEPDSLHALLSTARNERSLGTKRVAYITAEHLPQHVEKYLSLMPALPDGVRDALPADSSLTLEELPGVVKALKEAGRYGVDEGEPSLDALGQLIQEALFLTSYQLLDYQANWLSIGDEAVREEADRLSALLEGHCGQSLIKSFGREGDELVKLQRDFLLKADTKCLEQSCELYFVRLEDVYELNTEEEMNAIFAHEDFIDREMARKMNRRMSEERFQHWLQQLERTAPHSPTAIEFRISKAPETCADQIDGWEKRYPFDASLQTMFANYYMSEGMFDDAERCLHKRIELEQSYDAYKQLANMEKLRGDLDAWLEASLESLNYPVPGLEHASTNSAIARHYLNQGEPEKAEPYAGAAASTGAAWAMSVAADVQEALGNLEAADRYHRSILQRYENGMEWYLFRMRSGFGDLQEAGRALLEQYRGDLDKTEGISYADFKFGYLMHLTGEEERAYTRFKALCDDVSFPTYCWHVFAHAVVREDQDVRDEMLRRIISRAYEGHEDALLLETDGIARHLQERIAAGHPADLDYDLIDAEILSLPPGGPTKMWYILGNYLGRLGREREALRYLHRAAESPFNEGLESTLAAYILREFGAEPQPRRDREFIPLETPVNTTGAIVLKHSAQGAGVAFPSASATMVSIDWDEKGYFWNQQSGELQNQFEFEGDPERFSTDGRFLILTKPEEKLVSIRDVQNLAEAPRQIGIETGKPLGGWMIPGDDQLIVVLVRLVNRTNNPQDDLQLWDLDAGKRLWNHELKGEMVFHCRPELDGTHARFILRAQKNDSTMMRRLQLNDGTEVETRELPKFAVDTVGESLNETLIPMLSRWNEVRVWNMTTGETNIRFWRPQCTALALSRDGKRLAIGYDSGEIEFCDLEQQQVLTRFRDHRRRIRHLKFSDDDSLLVSSSDDATTRIWNVDQLITQQQTAAEPILTAHSNTIGMQFSPIPAGRFLMGRRAKYRTYRRYEESETPAHWVRITRPFYMSQTEVTVGQFRQFVEETGYVTEVERSRDGGYHTIPKTLDVKHSRKWTWKSCPFEQTDEHPVTLVNWNDANAFCQWLSETENRVYRLPTEAEWEYACRGGTASTWFRGNGFRSLDGYANVADVSYWEFNNRDPGTALPTDGFIFTAPVGSFRPNGYGLYDMLGNVSEWCRDWYDKDYYKRSGAEDPAGPSEGKSRVYRGGDYTSGSNNYRPARRRLLQPQYGMSRTGFRVVLEPETPQGSP